MASSKKLRHGELAATLATFLKQTVPAGQRLLLGLSGGLDSRVLLHLLANLREDFDFDLAALHVNHGISPHAEAWQQFCLDVCKCYNIPCTAQRVNIPRDSDEGLEAAARTARYAVLLSETVDYVVLAHHQDDQAETLLLQLLRGAGVKGVAAMQRLAMRDQLSTSSKQPKPIGLLRPLLDISRSTLAAYAKEHQLKWIEDESNLDLSYGRNFLRHQLFPELELRYPACRSTLARSAAHLAEAAELLDEVARIDADLWVRQGRLDLAGLRPMSEPRAKNLLRHWLSIHLPSLPSTRRLQDICHQLLDARPEAMIAIPLAGGCVRRYRDEAWFESAGGVSGPGSLQWQGEDELLFCNGRLRFRQSTGGGISLGKIGRASCRERVSSPV